MKEVITKILRDTGEFEEKDIDSSAAFVSQYVTAVMQTIDDMPDYDLINRLFLPNKQSNDSGNRTTNQNDG